MPNTITLSDVVKVYETNYRANYNEMLKRYGDFLKTNAYDPVVMAEVLLIGNHQARLNDVKKQRVFVCDAIKKLAKVKPWLKKYANFEDVYRDVQEILGDIKYIKDLAMYDVSLRLAAMYNLWPTKVYLNAGPLEAAKTMCDSKMINTFGRVMEKHDFPNQFQILRCDEIEDLLCVMGHYDVFSDLNNLSKVKTNVSSCSGYTSLFRRNLLAHKLLEEYWGEAPIPIEQLNILSDRLIFC